MSSLQAVPTVLLRQGVPPAPLLAEMGKVCGEGNALDLWMLTPASCACDCYLTHLQF